MKSDSSYSFEAVHKLIQAFRRSGYTPDDLEKLSSFSDLSILRDLICQKAELVYPETIMDSDLIPAFDTDFVSEINVHQHLRLGQVRFSPKLVELYLAPDQHHGVDGYYILQSLEGKKVLNAQILHLLMLNPCLIPSAWSTYRICFWGTLLKSRSGDLSIMTLNFMKENYFWEIKSLYSIFHANCLAAVFKDEALIINGHEKKQSLESATILNNNQ